MDDLVIENVSSSPLKTIEKYKSKSRFNLKDLTISLPLNTDQIFKMINNNNNETIENLPYHDKIPYDKNCGYFSMKKKNKYCYSNRCKGCQIIYRLIKTHLLEFDNIEIYYGRKKGKLINIERYRNFKSLYKRDEISEKLNIYMSKEFKSLSCNAYLDNCNIYATENRYYNYIITSILFNKLLSEKKIFLQNDYLWSFICRENINIFRLEKDYKTIEDLARNPYFSDYNSPMVKNIDNKKLSISCVKGIVKQLTIILYELIDNYFIHSEPSLKYINYNTETVNIPFKKENITFQFKISLTLNHYSSINYNNNRYFCNFHSNIKNTGLSIEKLDVYFNGTKNYLKKNKKLKLEEDYENLRIFGYKIGNKSEMFLQKIKNSGVPVFNQSFEFICFMVSFMSNNCFYKTFIECEKEVKAWKGLWKGNEYQNLMKDIEKLRNEGLNDFKNILKVVKKYYIRFDSLIYFYDNI